MPQDKDDPAQDDDIIEIELDDLAEAPEEPEHAQDADLLEISLDDLDEEPEPDAQAPAAGAKTYPGVDPAMLQQQQATDEIQMYVLCSETGQPFYVYWREVSPQAYSVSRVETATAERGEGAAGPMELHGTFSVAEFPGCPYCGCRRMSVCEVCGATICEAAVKTHWLGSRTLQCPNCGNRGEIAAQAGTAYGTEPGKGKKGKKG